MIAVDEFESVFCNVVLVYACFCVVASCEGESENFTITDVIFYFFVDWRWSCEKGDTDFAYGFVFVDYAYEDYDADEVRNPFVFFVFCKGFDKLESGSNEDGEGQEGKRDDAADAADSSIKGNKFCELIDSDSGCNGEEGTYNEKDEEEDRI